MLLGLDSQVLELIGWVQVTHHILRLGRQVPHGVGELLSRLLCHGWVPAEDLWFGSGGAADDIAFDSWFALDAFNDFFDLGLVDLEGVGVGA